MTLRMRVALTGSSLGLALVLVSSVAVAAGPEMKSAGPLAFGPEGVLFVGDTAGAAIFAIETGDRGQGGSGAADPGRRD